MANKKSPAKLTSQKSAKKITRISAKDDAPKTEKPAVVVTKISAKTDVKKPTKEEKEIEKAKKRAQKKALVEDPMNTKNYFKGAWQELRLVRWPTRQETWKLTFAVLAFTAFFTVIIIAIDILFQYLSKQLLG